MNYVKPENKVRAFIEHSLKVGSMTPPVNCRDIVHSGMSCQEYALYKFKTIFLSVFKIMVVAVLLPSVGFNFKKLDSQKLKEILWKFFNATIA